MNITGPFLDKAKHGQPSPWYLRYTAPRKNADGTTVLQDDGRPVMQRFRPYYQSKAKAKADITRINEQHDATGAGDFIMDRQAASEFDAAKKIVGEVSLLDVAKFWRRHHPEKPVANLETLLPLFLADIEMRLGKGRTWSDRQSRVKAFLRAGFAARNPDTVDRDEILKYIRGIPDAEPRTKRNHKMAVCEFFNFLLDEKFVKGNPAAGIKKKMLPREVKKEIAFLSLDQVERYLRAAERYDPGIVAHEIVQLIAGVRADDEMADFQAEFVLPQTREVVIPAAIAKTGKREVINSLEESFWTWWKAYGPAQGLLRPKYHEPRWKRIRVLATVLDQDEADELGRMPIKVLLDTPLARRALLEWPWNARRRTFCTYHVAMHQSADKTALIMRHRGSPYTLHNSYRGLGVTQDEGRAYFNLTPKPVNEPIKPIQLAKGIIQIQQQLKKAKDK